MKQLFKCAACGAKVEFPDGDGVLDVECPGCSVRVRRRPGDETMAIPVGLLLPDECKKDDLRSLVRKGEVLHERYRRTDRPKAESGSESDPALASVLHSPATSDI